MTTTIMTNEEIIRMAREVMSKAWAEDDFETWIERFATLVEQRVRSEIALEELTKQAQEQGEYK